MSKFVKYIFLIEAIFFALMSATSESYSLFHYSKTDNNVFTIGLLSTLPILCGALVQFLLNFKRFKISNHQGLVVFQIMQITGLILLFKNYFHPSLMTIFSGMILYWVGGQNALPFWMDWSSRIISFDDYSKFLSHRNKATVSISLITFLLISHWVNDIEAFFYIFLIGLIARITSFLLNLVILISNKQRSILKDNINSSPCDEEKIISKIIYPLSFFRISVNLASPFFLPYMLQELRLEAFDYALLTAAPMLSRFFVVGNWININKGAKPFQVIQICALGISILPILWILNTNFYALFCYQLLSGFFWTGMEFSSSLMVQNFTYGRSRFLLSKLNAFNTSFSVLGAIIGGILFRAHFDYSFVFSLSTFTRFISAFILIFALTKIPQTKLQVSLIRPILLGAISFRPSLANVQKIFFPRSTKESSASTTSTMSK